MIDLAEGKTCEPLDDFPFGTMDATGGLLNGRYPVICGGYVRQRPTTGQCAVLGSPGILLRYSFGKRNIIP